MGLSFCRPGDLDRHKDGSLLIWCSRDIMTSNGGRLPPDGTRVSLLETRAACCRRSNSELGGQPLRKSTSLSYSNACCSECYSSRQCCRFPSCSAVGEGRARETP